MMATKFDKKELFRFLGYLGLALLIAGYFRYSIHNIWSIWEQLMIGAGGLLLLLSVVMNFGDIKTFFSRRSTRLGTNTLAITAAVLAILALMNFLGYRHSQRFDLTEGQLYSLSDQTQQILSHLDRDVKFMLFDTEDSPPLRDRIQGYKSQSNHVSYEWVDPQEKPEVARQYGITRLGETIAVSGSHTERLENTDEQDITNAILKITRDKTKKVYFVEGHGEKSTSSSDADGYSTAKSGLENENYRVETVNLATANAVPSDCDVLVVAGPQQSLFPPEAAMIGKFLDGGGKAMLLLDPDTNPQVDDVLKKWGIEIGDDTVIETSALGQVFGTGPAVPLVTNYGLHPIAKGFKNTMTFFPLVRSVKRAADAPSAVTVTELLKTSANSWAETQLTGDEVAFDEGQDTKGPISLGAVASKKVDKKEARLVVIGDSDFATNRYIGLQRNGDLFFNAANWLAQDEDLISVRPKRATNRRITMTESQQNLLFWFSLILLPGAVIFSGIYVWWKRR